MDLQKTIAGINRLAARISPNSKLPTDLDESTFDSVFAMFVHVVAGAEGKAAGTGNMPELAMSAAMRKRPRNRTVYRDPTSAELADARRALGIRPKK